MKGVVQRLGLVVASVGLALVLAEVALAVHGRYNHLVSRQLVPSPAIWEPPANEVDIEPHPDLGIGIEIRLDSTGVRNHSAESTDRKREIVAFFGDSFTDNRRVADEFAFTTLLDDVAERSVRVVSYGVDGYGLDQAYLRYRKYRGHDIRHVVDLFCGNDLANLYATNLVEVHGTH